MNICLVPECGRAGQTRGLCEACYKAAQIAVLKGRATWKKLEDQGKCLPAKRRKTGDTEAWFVTNSKVSQIEEDQLIQATEKLKNDITSLEAQDHVRGMILDHIRDMMDTYGLTTTHTIGRLIASIESTMKR